MVTKQFSSVWVLIESVVWKYIREPNFLKLLSSQSQILMKASF